MPNISNTVYSNPFLFLSIEKKSFNFPTIFVIHAWKYILYFYSSFSFSLIFIQSQSPASLYKICLSCLLHPLHSHWTDLNLDNFLDLNVKHFPSYIPCVSLPCNQCLLGKQFSMSISTFLHSLGFLSRVLTAWVRGWLNSKQVLEVKANELLWKDLKACLPKPSAYIVSVTLRDAFFPLPQRLELTSRAAVSSHSLERICYIIAVQSESLSHLLYSLSSLFSSSPPLSFSLLFSPLLPSSFTLSLSQPSYRRAKSQNLGVMRTTLMHRWHQLPIALCVGNWGVALQTCSVSNGSASWSTGLMFPFRTD